MDRDEKIIIFKGPKEEFDKYIKKYFIVGGNNCTLSQLVTESMKELNTLHLKKDEDEQFVIDLLYISRNEYSGVTEAVINNFVNFISRYKINKIIIQNPPIEIINDIKRSFTDDDIHVHDYMYKTISTRIIKNFVEHSNEIILGQENALKKIAEALIIQNKLNKNNKPIVIMLYGPSGVGKTETGRLISELLGEEMFYSQFSMFQNIEHFNYLYGDTVQKNSFAKDLLNRKSNIIFLDEFDKANSIIYSSLYEMFDTGKFEDKNYLVDLKNTLIICTSNYKNQDKILEQLGAPMFFRINCFIEYKELSNEVKIKLIEKYYNDLIKLLSSSEQEKVMESKVKEKFINKVSILNNARQIENFIRNEISKVLINNI